MNRDQEKIEKLKKLVQMSTFFSASEKIKIFEKIPQMNDKEITNAMEILEEEQEKLEQMRKIGDENLNLMDDFVNKSEKEINSMAREIAHKIEADEEGKDVEEAEQLIKSIK